MRKSLNWTGVVDWLARQDASAAAARSAGAMDAVEWASIPGPKYYYPAGVERAFARLVKPDSGTRGAATSIRWAVGNDHAGTLYPASVAAARRLFQVIVAGPGRPREAALRVLLDWWGTFQPEPGYETFTGADGLTVELLPAIMDAASRARPAILLIAAEDPGTRVLTRQLLKCIDAGWQCRLPPGTRSP